MVFKVTSRGNNSTYGELFFSMPVSEELDKAIKEVESLCHAKMDELYGGMNFGVDYVEAEIYMMEKTGTAFNFLILKEIAELSREKGYPILIEGNLSSSVISYLLGISDVNPFEANYRCENKDCLNHFELIKSKAFGIDANDKVCRNCGEKMMKDGFSLNPSIARGVFSDPKSPDFSIGIAPEIRELIHSRLNQKFGNVKSDDEIYRRISLPDSSLCQKIGDMYKLSGTKPESKQFTNAVYLKVLENLSEDLKENAEFFESSDEKGYARTLAFANQLKDIKNCDFHTLCRIYAYIHGSFENGKSFKDLDNTDFWVTRDELLDELCSIGFDTNDALVFIKRGVWSQGERREKYIKQLKKHNASKSFVEYFEKTTNLWPLCACITRIQLICEKTWYEMNYKSIK